MGTNIRKELNVSISTMKMEAAGSSEMWLSIYQITSQKAIMLMLNRHANLVSHTGVQSSRSPYNVP